MQLNPQSLNNLQSSASLESTLLTMKAGDNVLNPDDMTKNSAMDQNSQEDLASNSVNLVQAIAAQDAAIANSGDLVPNLGNIQNVVGSVMSERIQLVGRQ